MQRFIFDLYFLFCKFSAHISGGDQFFFDLGEVIFTACDIQSGTDGFQISDLFICFFDQIRCFDRIAVFDRLILFIKSHGNRFFLFTCTHAEGDDTESEFSFFQYTHLPFSCFYCNRIEGICPAVISVFIVLFIKIFFHRQSACI